jgi:hypothetical protein
MKEGNMHLYFAAAALVFSLTASRAESVYTRVDLDNDCTLLEKSDDGGGSWKCQGYKDYPIWFSEGDARQSIFYGHLGDWYKETAWESFGPFNHYGGTVEWLIENGKPFAAISRFFIQNSEEDIPKNEGQTLVISKVGQSGMGEACVAAYVDARANKEPNALARKVAGEVVKGFKCRVDIPVYHGIEGLTAGPPSRTFGDN